MSKKYVDTRVIAQLSGKQHAHICRDVRRFFDSNENTVCISTYDDITDCRTKILYFLTEEQSIELMGKYSIYLRIKMEKWWKGEIEDDFQNNAL